jgi:LemA protein
MIPAIIILGIIILWAVVTYNGFTRLRTQKDEAWADIDVQLKRRYDLIPNLVNTVKGYASHETAVFEKVTLARSQAMQAGGLSAHAQAEAGLTGALKSLFAVSEAYPDLKANTNFVALQRELADTENKIQASRRFYNSIIQMLNTKIDTIPSNIIARLIHAERGEFFNLEASPEQRENIKVTF